MILLDLPWKIKLCFITDPILMGKAKMMMMTLSKREMSAWN